MLNDQPVRVGQIWRARDRRDNGQLKEVLAVIPTEDPAHGGGMAVMMGLARSTIRFTTLRIEYIFVRESATQSSTVAAGQVWRIKAEPDRTVQVIWTHAASKVVGIRTTDTNTMSQIRAADFERRHEFVKSAA